MAAAGTGLPGGRGDVATTLVDTAAYGAGEAVAAEGMARAAEGIGRLVDTLKPALNQKAQELAQQDVMAGEFRQRMTITDSDAAYNQAMQTGTLARLSNAADADLDALRAKHLMDPDGFAAEAAEMRTASLGAAVPSQLALAWADDFDRRANSHLGVIRNARAQNDLTEAKNGTIARIGRLTDETIALRPGLSLADVLADDTVAGNMFQITQLYETLANNPAFGVSREEVDAMAETTRARIKAGAVSAWVQNTLRTEGTDAAYGQLQTILTDESIGTVEDRQLAFNTAREAVNAEVGLENQRRAQAASELAQREQEINRLIEEDVSGIQLNGIGSGLTAEQVREKGGNPAVVRWLKQRAEAQEFHGLVGTLPLDDPDAAAAQIVAAGQRQGFSAFPVIQDDGDLATLANAIEFVESRGVNGLVSADPDGSGGARGGAMGVRQMLPETAARVARQMGIPFDARRLRNDPAYNRQISDFHLKTLIDRYGGDSFLAATAYYAGEGNVDSWLRSVGDPRTGAITREQFTDGVRRRGNPLSADYPGKVLAAMNGGRANATWDAYQGRRTARDTDPAAFVAQDFSVQAAAQRWRANDQSVPAAEAYVQASVSAQERQNVPAGNRRTLPLASLTIYAGDLERFARANDTAGFTEYSQRVVRNFGRYGEQVLQDVLEVRGDTRYAAQVAARATATANRGQRPQPAQVEQAATAQRANTMARTAAGTAQPVAAMTDAQVLAAAGLGQ